MNSLNEDNLSIIEIRDEKSMKIFKDYHYNFMTFDKIIKPECSNLEIFDNIIPILNDFCTGKSSCTVFAQGQTGAGKTHTITGYTDNDESLHSKNEGILQLSQK